MIRNFVRKQCEPSVLFASPVSFNVSPLSNNVSPAPFLFSINSSPKYSCVQAKGRYDCKPPQLSKEFQPKLGWMVGNLYSRVGVTDWKEKGHEQTFDEAHVINDILSFTKRDQPLWIDKKLYNKLTEINPDFENLSKTEQDAIIEENKPQPPKEEILDIIAKCVDNIMPRTTPGLLDMLKSRLNNDEKFESRIRKYGTLE